MEFVSILSFLSLFNFEIFLVPEKNSHHDTFELTHIFGRKGEREGEKGKKKNRDDWMVGQDRRSRSRKTMRTEDKKRFALMMLFTVTNERGR